MFWRFFHLFCSNLRELKVFKAGENDITELPPEIGALLNVLTANFSTLKLPLRPFEIAIAFTVARGLTNAFSFD